MSELEDLKYIGELWNQIGDSRKKSLTSTLIDSTLQLKTLTCLNSSIKQRSTLNETGYPVVAFEWHKENKYILSISKETKLALWNPLDGNRIVEKSVRRDKILRISPSGNLFATSGSSSPVIVRNYPCLKTERFIKFEDEGITSFEFLPYDDLMIFSTKNGKAFTWDIDYEKAILEVGFYDLKNITCMDLSTSFIEFRHLVAAGDNKGNLAIFDVLSGKKAFEYKKENKLSINCLRFHPSHGFLAVGYNQNHYEFIDLRSDNVIHSCDNFSNSGDITCMDYFLSGRVLIMGTSTGKIIQVDLMQPENPFINSAHSECINCLKLAPDGFGFATCSDDQTIKIWE